MDMVKKISSRWTKAISLPNLSPSDSIQLEFMQRFGYLDTRTVPASGAGGAALEIAALYSETAVTQAIKSVQRFAALQETGVMDDETIKVSAPPVEIFKTT